MKEVEMTCNMSKTEIQFEKMSKNPEELTQFILDPTSFNLTNRVNISDPIVKTLFGLSRDICYSIHTERMKILQELKKAK